MSNRITTPLPTERTAFGLVAWLEQTKITLPLKGVECRFNICGDVASVEIDQIFQQNSSRPLDCLYTFPLPASAAVFRCEMHVNGRVISARVEEHERAKELAQEIRDLIISTVATTGGHLAPNLGVVELTIALHYVFDAAYDRFIWDVGHQAYPHKVLTGRREQLHTIRKYGGLAPFCSIGESEHDTMGAGHASTASGTVSPSRSGTGIAFASLASAQK